MQPELEEKYILPDNVETRHVIHGIDREAGQHGWSVERVHPVSRRVLYYDTSDLQLLEAGSTLRRISGFDDGRNRYDYKTGVGMERQEGSHWFEEELTSTQVGKLFGLNLHVYVTVTADMDCWKVDFRNKETLAESTVDTISHAGEVRFREWELELKYGFYNKVEQLARAVATRCGLEKSTMHKYQRVML